MTDLVSVTHVMCYALEHPCAAHDSEAARQLNLSPALVERCLRDLIKAGLLTHNASSQVISERRIFQPGPRALQLTAAVAANYPVTRIADPVLRALADATGERAVLNAYVPSLRAVVCVAMQQGPCPLQYDIEVGEVKALHAGASGKVVLACLSLSEIETILASRLERVTAHTEINADSLRAEIGVIRQQGYALSRGQRVEGAVGIAASLSMPGGIPGSLVVTIPEHRFNEDSVTLLSARIIETARKLEQLFTA